MKNLNDSYNSYYNSFFSHIYVEKSVINHPRTKQLMEKFPEAEIIKIDHYKDVFCRSRQYTAGQHRAQQLILAAKKIILFMRELLYARVSEMIIFIIPHV